MTTKGIGWCFISAFAVALVILIPLTIWGVHRDAINTRILRAKNALKNQQYYCVYYKKEYSGTMKCARYEKRT